MAARILVVDNYDSFVYNLVQYLQQLAAETTVVRNDEIEPADAAAYDGVLLSPGPGTPEEAGICVDLVRTRAGKTPVFGVCLGLQAIGVAFGGVVSHAADLMHGRTSPVHHDGTGVFAGLPSPFTATRYHSLAVDRDRVPADLRVTAWTESGTVMGLAHRSLPLVGVQFHPESVLTEGGYLLLGTWLEGIGVMDAAARGARLSPHRTVT